MNINKFEKNIRLYQIKPNFNKILHFFKTKFDFLKVSVLRNFTSIYVKPSVGQFSKILRKFNKTDPIIHPSWLRPECIKTY